MSLEKIYEMLGLEKLDESKQSEVKDVLVSLIDTKAEEKTVEKVEEKMKEERETLTEEFEQKFEDYKTEIIEKFSNFVDTIIEEEMEIPENVLEYARLGELYSDLVEQFKVRLAIDEGMITDEVNSMLKEAKEEIFELRNLVNEETAKTLELENDAKKMAANIYLRNKCEGLTESQKQTVMNLLEDETSKEKIDTKFESIVESLKTNIDDNPVDPEPVNTDTDDPTKQSVTDPVEPITEDGDPWQKQLKQWSQILENGKI